MPFVRPTVPPHHTLAYLNSYAGASNFVRYGNQTEQPLVNIHVDCDDCHIPMTNWHKKCRRCTRCGLKKSIYKHTFFEKSKMSAYTILNMGYDWLNGMTNDQLMKKYGRSSHTITNWFKFFQQLVAADLETQADEDKIGGQDVVVEIDEAKFGKRMFNQGHRVKGVWVVGGVERTPERRMFAVSVVKRDAQTLRQIIQNHVAPGSIVNTDCWSGYRTEDLHQLGLTHNTVNHSQHFKDPVTGTHTNTIEGTWAGIRIQVPRRKRTQEAVDGHLLTYVWKRRHAANIWARFLHAIRTVRYIDNVPVHPDAEIDDEILLPADFDVEF